MRVDDVLVLCSKMCSLCKLINENTLINMFITIQPYFSVICPDERVNFIRYHYTLYKQF